MSAPTITHREKKKVDPAELVELLREHRGYREIFDAINAAWSCIDKLDKESRELAAQIDAATPDAIERDIADLDRSITKARRKLPAAAEQPTGEWVIEGKKILRTIWRPFSGERQQEKTPAEIALDKLQEQRRELSTRLDAARRDFKTLAALPAMRERVAAIDAERRARHEEIDRLQEQLPFVRADAAEALRPKLEKQREAATADYHDAVDKLDTMRRECAKRLEPLDAACEHASWRVSVANKMLTAL
jgi:uncharacterized coiled-coil DUF342 family protein